MTERILRPEMAAHLIQRKTDLEIKLKESEDKLEIIRRELGMIATNLNGEPS